MVSLPIFIILIGVLVSISNLTTVPWNIEPTGQSMATLTDDTEVTFDNPSGETLPAKGTYEVTERYILASESIYGDSFFLLILQVCRQIQQIFDLFRCKVQ